MFSIRLKELRLEKGLTQKELSARLNLSPNSVCEWEKGRCEPNIDTLKKLSNIFNCSIDYLAGTSDDFGCISFNNQTDELTSEERKLVKDFRNLAPPLQRMLLATIETWKGSDANANTGADTTPRRA